MSGGSRGSHVRAVSRAALLSLALGFPSASSAQDAGTLADNVAWLQARVGPVEINEDRYEQQLEHLTDVATGQVRLTVTRIESDGDTRTEVFEFHLSDIDRNTVVRDVDGRMLTVNLTTINEQNLIQRVRDGRLENYVDEVRIIFDDTEVTEEVIATIRETIPLSSPGQMTWTGRDEALDWLESAVGSVVIEDTEYRQRFEVSPDADYRITVSIEEVSDGGGIEQNIYELYLADMVPNAVNFDVDGKELSAEIVTRGERDYVKRTEDGEQQNYVDRVSILASSLEDARNLVGALRLAAEDYSPPEPTFSSASEGMGWLSDQIGTIPRGDEELRQRLSFDASSLHAVLDVTIVEDDGEEETEQYDFYLYDVDEHGLTLEVSGRTLRVRVPMRAERRFVRTHENGELTNFEDELEIVAADIRQGRQVISALRHVVSEVADDARSWAGSDAREALEWLDTNLGQVVVRDLIYEQQFALEAGDPCRVTYTQVRLEDDGDRTERLYLFSLDDLNPRQLEAEAHGREMRVEVTTKAREKLVQNYEDGELENYREDFELITADARVARDAIEALRFLIEQCS